VFSFQVLTKSQAVARKAERAAYDVRNSWRTVSGTAIGNWWPVIMVRLFTVCC